MAAAAEAMRIRRNISVLLLRERDDAADTCASRRTAGLSEASRADGAIGLSTDLRVFEPATKSARQRNLPDAERIALANYMVDLWTQFRDQHHNVPNQTSVDGDVQARRESLARVISTSKRT